MVQSITKLSLNDEGTFMGFQTPLLVIDRRSVSIMSASFANRRETRLKLGDALSRYGNYWRVILETEVCSESRMGSKTSRGDPEWSGE